jgi:restriction endonuclease S subunit
VTSPERQLEEELIEKLLGLKYEYRADIRDRAALENNFREKFEALNRVRLTAGEFPRLLDEIVTPDVFTAAHTLRNRNSFTRDDGTPLNYTLVNINDWCKNTFEVINQLRINTDNSHHRYDVILLINGVPVVQIELKTLDINPRRAIEQIVDYKNDPGNGYTRTLLCFVQLFIVSNQSSTYYFANNNARHFAFNAAYIVLTPQEGISSAFFGRLLKTPGSLRWLTSHSRGLTKDRLRLYYKDFVQIPLPLPSPAEQQKIADCLTSLDELIAAQGRKVEVLKAHKQGLMQQLFPRPGGSRPRLRFPEFHDAGEWETKRVDERGNVLAGKALAVTAPGPIRPYLRTKNVLDGTIDLSDVLTMPMTDAEFSRFEILDGDILLNEGQSLELVGRTAMYRGQFRQRCAMQNQLLRFRAFPSTCPEFAAQAFRKCQKDGTFASIATKTTSVAHLGSSRFSALPLTWPPSLAEQQRIAACLSSLDGVLAGQGRMVEGLKLHKKGLMQQLFPSVEG